MFFTTWVTKRVSLDHERTHELKIFLLSRLLVVSQVDGVDSLSLNLTKDFIIVNGKSERRSFYNSETFGRSNRDRSFRRRNVIEGVWHTGIVVYGNEYFFGGGIQHLPAGTTPYGAPLRTVELGESHVPKDRSVHAIIAESYNMLTHAATTSATRSPVSGWLRDSDYILQLPNEVMNSPMGGLLSPKLPNKPSENQIKSEKASKSEDAKTSVPTEKASQVSQASSNKEKVKEDPLGDARTKIQEEITREFAALMEQGTLRASEAAVMATKE
ncbi:hypothetical protein Bca52824_073104 [Brassica carinata]|uniref:PPPDE domain-containing protein n=1 Tax=Brassica carinata TaxID=52824 RepID=A0A8X7U4I9_BRACI|nr:hypothetical protein Bca52824_073104 [Brassica carinata]